MEDASDTLAVERAMAGAVRLCGLPAAERARLAAPLVRRAEQRLRDYYYGPFGGHEIASDIAGLTLAWGCGRVPDIMGARRVWGSEDREAVLRSGQARTMAGILTARIWEASTLAAAGNPVELLAEPEFERGPISPDRLLGRLGSWAGRALPRHDLEIALLRLAPGPGGLLPSGHPLGEIGHLAVITGLASAEPYVRIAAAEVWMRACRDGRLDPALAAGAIAAGVIGGALKLNRVADGLQHASHDPVAGQPIVQAVLATTEHLVPAKPPSLHLLLELAARIGAAPGTRLPAAITRLASGKNSSGLAAAARRLAQGTP